MLTFSFNNKKLKVKRDNLICAWSQNICSINDNNVDLERYDIEDFKNLVRVMQIIKTSEEFKKSIEIFASMLSGEDIRNLLTLIHELKLVPPIEYSISKGIPEDGSLANVLAPIMANIEKNIGTTSNNKSQSGGGVSNLTVIKALLV